MRNRSSRGGRELAPLPRLVVPGRELRGPGGWPTLFGRSAPLVVEVGFGKDPFLLERAARSPELNLIGIERDPARVERYLERAAERGLDNLRVLPVSAELALGLCLPDATVLELHVYFPDPWPKERHAHNRLVQPWFAREARRVLRPDGELLMATDHPEYAAHMSEVLEGGGFVNLAGPGALTDRPLREPVEGHTTKFESLWRRRGRTIHHLALRPVPAPDSSAPLESHPPRPSRR